MRACPEIASVALLALLAILAAACGDATPISDRDVALRVATDAREVELGRAFPLTVVRAWKKNLVPEDWKDDALAPLELRLVETERREDETHVEETRRYDAYAFDLGEIVVPAPSFAARPRDGGVEVVARAHRIDLLVRGSLDPAAPGPPELPGGLLSEPSSWTLAWAVAAGAGLILATALIRRRRRRALRSPTPDTTEAPAETSAPIGPSLLARSLERLASLRERRPTSAEEVLAWFVEAANLLRDHIGERFEIRTPDRTSEELVADVAPAFDGSSRLMALLRTCDAVKFARVRPPEDGRDRWLDDADAFLRETAGESGS